MDVGSWSPQPEDGGQFREETPQQAHACAAFQVIGFDMNGLLGVTCLFLTNAISNIHSVVRTPCWEVRCLLHVCALWCGHGIVDAYRFAQPLCLCRPLVRGCVSYYMFCVVCTCGLLSTSVRGCECASTFSERVQAIAGVLDQISQEAEGAYSLGSAARKPSCEMICVCSLGSAA